MSSIKVSSFGAYLTSWQINGKEVLYQGSELKRTGIPFLFPNFDAGAPLPSHGFGRISEWKKVEESENFCHLQLTDNDISPEFRQIYPYKFVVDLKIKCFDNQLDYIFCVQNLGEKDMPISPGLHPYWPVNHFQKNQINLVKFTGFDPSLVDWEKNPPDNLYKLSSSFAAKFPDYCLKIEELSKTKYFKHLQIWSQNSSFSDFNFVCFEPVFSPPNGINSQPTLVKVKQKLAFHLRFQIDFSS